MKLGRRAFLASSAALTCLGATMAQAGTIRMRIHTLVKSPHPYNDMAAAMKAEIEAKSGGRVAVQIFDSGQLGQDPAVIGEMGLGTIDVMISTTSNAAEQVPEYAIFTMPYLFEGMDQALSKIGPGTAVQAHFESVYEKRELGIRLLALGVSGTRNLSTASVAVNDVGDLAGVKMRTPPSPMDSKTWAALGMLPVTVAWGELYAAVQTGVAQALESSLPGYSGSKLYEVAPNLALTEHTLQVNHISISDVTWKKLGPELQGIVATAAENANRLGVEKAKGYDADMVSELETEHGVKVTRPAKSEFIAKLKPIQPELAKQLNLTAEFELLSAQA